MPPEVTVGLPVYNGERYLEAAIGSILAQSFTDFELVISDNASTDGTSVICKEYVTADPRVRYHRLDTNIGCRGNFHAAFGLGSGGRYFKWAGHDDRIEPDYLARCVDHLDSHPGDVLCQTLIRMTDGDDADRGAGPIPMSFDHARPHARMRSLFGQQKTHQTIFGLMRRDVLARTHLLGPWYAADRALLIELSLHGGFGLVPETLFVSRDHEERGDYADDVLDWFVPERAGSSEAGYWHHLWWVSRALATAPMSPSERLLCLGELGRRASVKVGEWVPILAREASESLRNRSHQHSAPDADDVAADDQVGATATATATAPTPVPGLATTTATAAAAPGRARPGAVQAA